MRYSFFIAALLFVFVPVFLNAGNADTLTDTNAQRLQLQKTGMITLGAWAVGNIAMGGIGMSQASGSRYHFHQMNLFWNVVNLGIAAGGYYGAASASPSGVTALHTLNEFHAFNKILLLNAGLDVAYMVGGLYLKERAKTATKRKNMLQGFGSSVIIQGGFLLAFDLVMYGMMNSKMNNFLESSGLTITASGGTVGLVYSF